MFGLCGMFLSVICSVSVCCLILFTQSCRNVSVGNLDGNHGHAHLLPRACELACDGLMSPQEQYYWKLAKMTEK